MLQCFSRYRHVTSVIWKPGTCAMDLTCRVDRPRISLVGTDKMTYPQPASHLFTTRRRFRPTGAARRLRRDPARRRVSDAHGQTRRSVTACAAYAGWAGPYRTGMAIGRSQPPSAGKPAPARPQCTGRLPAHRAVIMRWTTGTPIPAPLGVDDRTIRITAMTADPAFSSMISR